jgi:hypothetical protein
VLPGGDGPRQGEAPPGDVTVFPPSPSETVFILRFLNWCDLLSSVLNVP